VSFPSFGCWKSICIGMSLANWSAAISLVAEAALIISAR